jgi:probable HAF family extracellular repeat protein
MCDSFLHSFKQALAAVALSVLVPAMAACGGPSALTPSAASAGTGAASGVERTSAYRFKTLDDPDNPTFNELLGINNLGKIAGYYGSGSRSNPSVGYIIRKYGNSHFQTIVYPGAVNTRVTALDNHNDVAGSYDTANGTFGFILTSDGLYLSYKDPHTHGATNITELLGLSDSSLGVGYYVDANNVKHAFELIQPSGEFHGIVPPGSVSSVASGINGKGDIVGYFTKSDGSTEGFLLKGGAYTEFSYKGSANMTEALGINWQDEIAGVYADSAGKMHGFVLDNLLGTPDWAAPIDDPSANGTTVVTGIQNHHDLVGYYVDGGGNTNGFLAMPSGK